MAFDIWPLAVQIGGYILVIIGGMLFIGASVIAAYWWKKQQVYKKYKVLVWKKHIDKSGHEMPVFVAWDKGAVIKDKKLNKWVFHLRDWNIDFGEDEGKNSDEMRNDLDIPSMPNETGGEVVFVEKLGFRKGALGVPFLFDGNVAVKVSHADLAEAMRAFDMNAKAFGTKDNKMMAFILYVILAAFILVIILVILNKFETIASAAESFKQGATAAAAAKGSAVASGVPG